MQVVMQKTSPETLFIHISESIEQEKQTIAKKLNVILSDYYIPGLDLRYSEIENFSDEQLSELLMSGNYSFKTLHLMQGIVNSNENIDLKALAMLQLSIVKKFASEKKMDQLRQTLLKYDEDYFMYLKNQIK